MTDANSPIDVLSGDLERFQTSQEPTAAATLRIRDSPIFSTSGLRRGDSGGPAFWQCANHSETQAGAVIHVLEDQPTGQSLMGIVTSFSNESTRKFLYKMKHLI